MEITINVRNVYGQEVAYPACVSSKRFARIAKTRTLTEDTLYQIKQLGYRVRIQRTMGKFEYLAQQ